ncbi:hypothetical protein AB835_10040 [Candidatus Endobugula sertula]|uniref:Uroporphyrinogen-III synthase n=1 Tax=Candidatus Endobugula sertula TaxID=62101 RepID=A0A1D2QNW4_9GAMM|nr:hypothetical protein AB835_10040 [Candidatus Endobugula sertula]
MDNYHLLVTRPEDQAVPWVKQLKALGASVSLQPMMVIKPVTEVSAKQRITNHILAFDTYQKAIFISQNAVKYGLQWLDQYWPQLPMGVAFFAIGKATLAALENNTMQLDIHSASEAMNSEALLSHKHLQHINGENIIIFRGQGGRRYLAEQLRERGANVDYCELYQRVAPSHSLQPLEPTFKSSDKQTVLVVHSGETLENLCNIIEQNDLLWLLKQPILLPGERVAELAANAGFSQRIVAHNATHNSMIEALYDWQQ